ncbi:aminoacyl-histidine dipeptidase [Marinomonas agarivorans]|nr:aminoacyl-histidine dipeptidase [Marinomonas agarivorans]
MNQHLEQLEPTSVWRHFRTLCNIPRPSFYEAQLRDLLFNWAQSKGLEAYIDPCGNLLIRKPASKGMENRETVVLQGHLDMVAQKNEGVEHDFTKDPIKTEIIDGWVTAKQTTLGADNGIGVAAALAVLEATDIAHGPIEALFTIEEESSLRGAAELQEELLTGRLLFNLDSEDRGDVYIGCAGGIDINIQHSYATQTVSDDQVGYELSVSGLRGGHSGLDIHKGRASATVLLVRLLSALNEQCIFQLSSLKGGTLRNAIAREAKAILSIAPDQISAIKSCVKVLKDEIIDEFDIVENEIKINLKPCQKVSKVLRDVDKQVLVETLKCAPHGVEKISVDLPNVTETSCNFGVVNLELEKEGFEFSACFLVRSLIDLDATNLASKIKTHFEKISAQVFLENDYPGWQPDANSNLLSYFLDTHKDVMGYDANVKVIHAGLECGIIGAKYKNMEMVSFGPNIRGAHSPDERLEIDSVADFWRLLVRLLANIPVRCV